MNEWLSINYLVWLAAAGALFAFLWWRGHLLRLRMFVESTKAELRKCSWPTTQELKGSTVLVILATALLGLVVVLWDTVFHGLITWLIY